MYDNNSNQSESRDDESFHEEIDWYHVLEYHDNYTRRRKNRTVLEERIEEYILQGIAEEFNPSFNEDFFASETATANNIGYDGVTSESNLFPFSIDDAVKVGSIIDAPLSHFNFQRHFNAEEYFMIKLCNICDKANTTSCC